ncbi:MAG: ACP S-malonyltransferase [Puniceicoccales bacterium]|nr:ACP S-malonyltransferase [Puniceicoccales bacterium]
MASGVLFSGQGAQRVGMGSECADSAILCTCLAQASDVLHLDLQKICFEGPQEELTRTDVCQVALYAVGYGIFKTLADRGLLPDVTCYAGLSLGEWTALAAAGAFAFEDGLPLVALRGRLMDEACRRTSGGMLSLIGGTRDEISILCRQTGLYPSNFNAPDQVVISGATAGITAATELVKNFSFRRAIPLNVAGAYHSPLMAEAREAFRPEVDRLKIRKPSIDVFSNVTGRPHESSDDIRHLLVEQITAPVQWETCMQTAAALGVNSFCECGAGKVLVGLVKKNIPSADAYEAGKLLGATGQ